MVAAKPGLTVHVDTLSAQVMTSTIIGIDALSAQAIRSTITGIDALPAQAIRSTIPDIQYVRQVRKSCVHKHHASRISWFDDPHHHSPAQKMDTVIDVDCSSIQRENGLTYSTAPCVKTM